MRAGRCLGPEGNGVSSGEGGEGRPGTQGRRQHGAGRRRKDELGVMKKSQHAQSDHFQEGFLQQCD
jgi:hypothetical protein